MNVLLDQIRARIAEGQPCDNPDEWLEPQPLVSPSDLERAEARLGFRLPELLRRLYTEIGNGGFGPVFGLLPLHPLADAEFDLVGDYHRLVQRFSGAAAGWPTGLVPAFYCGCTVFEFIDCRDAAAPMIWFDEGSEDLTVISERRAAAVPSLDRRLEMWLNGESPW